MSRRSLRSPTSSEHEALDLRSPSPSPTLISGPSRVQQSTSLPPPEDHHQPPTFTSPSRSPSPSSPSSGEENIGPGDLAALQTEIDKTDKQLKEYERRIAEEKKRKSLKQKSNTSPSPDPRHSMPPNTKPPNRPQAQDYENSSLANVRRQRRTYVLTEEDYKNFIKIPPSPYHSIRSQSDGAVLPATLPLRRRLSEPETGHKLHGRIPIREPAHPPLPPMHIRLLGPVEPMYDYINAQIGAVPGIIDNCKRAVWIYALTAWAQIQYPLALLKYCIHWILVTLWIGSLRITMRMFLLLLPYLFLFYVCLFLLYIVLGIMRQTSSINIIFGIADLALATPAAFVLCMVPGIRPFDEVTYHICPILPATTQPPPSDNPNDKTLPKGSKNNKPTVEESEVIARFEYLISPAFWEDSLGHAHGLEAVGENLRLHRAPYERLYHSWKWTVDPVLQERRSHVLGSLQSVAASLEDEAEALIFFHGKVATAYLNTEVTLGYFRDKMKMLLDKASDTWAWTGMGGYRREREKLKVDYIYFAGVIIAEIDEMIAYVTSIIKLTVQTDDSLEQLRAAMYRMQLARQQVWDAQWAGKRWWWWRRGSEYSKEEKDVTGIIEGHTDMIISLSQVRDMLKNRRNDWREFKGVLGRGAIGSKIVNPTASSLTFNTAPSTTASSTTTTIPGRNRGQEDPPPIDTQRILGPAEERTSLELHFTLVDRMWLDYKLKAKEAWKNTKGKGLFGSDDDNDDVEQLGWGMGRRAIGGRMGV